MGSSRAVYDDRRPRSCCRRWWFYRVGTMGAEWRPERGSPWKHLAADHAKKKGFERQPGGMSE